MKKGHYVYLLECADSTLYCGYAVDVERRVAVHNQAKGAKYTRSRLPVRLVYCERCDTREDALHRECAIKALSRREKLELIRSGGVFSQ